MMNLLNSSPTQTTKYHFGIEPLLFDDVVPPSRSDIKSVLFRLYVFVCSDGVGFGY